MWSTPRELKHRVNEIIAVVVVVLFVVAFAQFIIIELEENIIGFLVSMIDYFYDVRIIDSDFPNDFSLQYVMPDQNRHTDQGKIEYNVAIDMHAESFSARMPIKVEAQLILRNHTLPKGWGVDDKLYVIFIGSRNEPTEYTGLGQGHYSGYIEATRINSTDGLVRYQSQDSKIILYEMGGQYPIVISNVSPTIVQYNSITNIADYPQINIGSEKVTRGLENERDAERIENINLSLAIAILAISILGLRPVIHQIIDEHYASRNDE